MSISATSSAGSTPPPTASSSTQTSAPAKTDASSPSAATPEIKKDRTVSSGAQDEHFNVQMPIQPVSNGLGQTIGQHLNLRA
ncbi:MAG: hypothetical protein NTZ15_01965 [Burkholderiales bacterium]|nr:hypothetical protein [Burkholderiales bacterium]